MRSGILIGLLAAGGLATGVMGASFTTRAIQHYRSAYVTPPRQAPFGDDQNYGAPEPEYQPDQYASSPNGQDESWLEQRFSALDTPAWPFGPDEWDAPERNAHSYGGRSDGYAPDADDAPHYGNAYPDDSYTWEDQPEREEWSAPDDRIGQKSGEAQSAARDPAADAAARAGAAANDVLEAERSPS